MTKLTLRQQEILGFIQLYARQQGTWPSIRDIMKHFGFVSTNAVMGHVRALERKGALSRVPGQARTYRINCQLNDSDIPAEALQVVELPIMGPIAAGYPDGIEPAGVVNTLQVDVETAGLRRSRRTFALKVTGESMIDAGIEDGDMVVVEQVTPKHNDIVAALIDGGTTLKRFIHLPGQAPYLKAENKNYPSLHPLHELIIQGVARSVVRSL